MLPPSRSRYPSALVLDASSEPAKSTKLIWLLRMILLLVCVFRSSISTKILKTVWDRLLFLFALLPATIRSDSPYCTSCWIIPCYWQQFVSVDQPWLRRFCSLLLLDFSSMGWASRSRSHCKSQGMKEIFLLFSVWSFCVSWPKTWVFHLYPQETPGIQVLKRGNLQPTIWVLGYLRYHLSCGSCLSLSARRRVLWRCSPWEHCESSALYRQYKLPQLSSLVRKPYQIETDLSNFCRQGY